MDRIQNALTKPDLVFLGKREHNASALTLDRLEAMWQSELYRAIGAFNTSELVEYCHRNGIEVSKGWLRKVPLQQSVFEFMKSRDVRI